MLNIKYSPPRTNQKIAHLRRVFQYMIPWDKQKIPHRGWVIISMPASVSIRSTKERIKDASAHRKPTTITIL